MYGVSGSYNLQITFETLLLEDLDLFLVRCLIPLNIRQCCFRLLVNLFYVSVSKSAFQ
jgi:hypothetical protein